MGRPPGWSTRFTGRKALRSPGTPGISNKRQRQREFWEAIAEGLGSEDAGTRVGISGAVAARWFRDTGGMRPSTLAKTLSGRYLSFEEREEIALLRAKDLGVREIARHLGRSASTVSRELRRNAATRGGTFEYRASAAQWHAERSARRPKPAKLVSNQRLHDYVQQRLSGEITDKDGNVVGPEVEAFKGRRHGRRKDRRWAASWSHQQMALRVSEAILAALASGLCTNLQVEFWRKTLPRTMVNKG